MSVESDLPEEIIPQRGLVKAFYYERHKSLSRSDYSVRRHSEQILSREGIQMVDADLPVSDKEPLVEMQGVCLRYGDKEVLGSSEQKIDGQLEKGLSWTIRRGDRWGVFGPNGV